MISLIFLNKDTFRKDNYFIDIPFVPEMPPVKVMPISFKIESFKSVRHRGGP